MSERADRAGIELYACLRVHEFPAQAMLRLRPELRARAVAVLAGEAPLERVCSLNDAAAALGVAHGMTRVEMDMFPAVTLLRRSSGEETAAREALLECAARFSPRVEEVRTDSDSAEFLCVADIAGTERLFGPPEKLGARLVQTAQAVGIHAAVAVSRNFPAAVCAARGGLSGVRVIPAGKEREALAELPLTVLEGLSAAHAETLAMWGITTPGMLAELPELELTARLGQEGARLRRLARGAAEHHFLPVEAEFAPEERMELDTPVEDLESLLFVMGVLLDHLLARTAARSLALATVTLTLMLEDRGEHTRRVRPALPSNDRPLWLKLLHLDLQAHPPQAAMVAVTLRGEPGSPSRTQLGLFSPQLPEEGRLEVTLARIRAVVGEGHVGRPVLLDTHGPENFRVEPFTVPVERPRSAAMPARAAMRRLRPAEALTVTVQNQRPAALVFRERRYRVEEAWGPWKTRGGWWHPAAWDREQWDVAARAEDGAFLCCCLVRDALRHGWAIEALYD